MVATSRLVLSITTTTTTQNSARRASANAPLDRTLCDLRARERERKHGEIGLLLERPLLCVCVTAYIMDKREGKFTFPTRVRFKLQLE